jgi:hypothetical protein
VGSGGDFPATPTVVLTAGELLQRHHSKLLFGRTVSVLVLFETPMEYFRVRADHVFTVTIADHQQLEYPHGAADNSWQQFGPISSTSGSTSAAYYSLTTCITRWFVALFS